MLLGQLADLLFQAGQVDPVLSVVVTMHPILQALLNHNVLFAYLSEGALLWFALVLWEVAVVLVQVPPGIVGGVAAAQPSGVGDAHGGMVLRL